MHKLISVRPFSFSSMLIHRHALLGAFAMGIAVLTTAPMAQPVTSPTVVIDDQDTGTEMLSSEDWNNLTHEQRRERSRRRIRAQYVPDGGAASADHLADYVAKFAELTVYDSRYYLFDVTASHVSGTTGSVILSGETYPPNFGNGVRDGLESLGFNIAENNIVALPKLDAGQAMYGVSTTTAATLRKQPRRRSEQLNSVALGGWIRVLRSATIADEQSGERTSSRRAPGANRLQPDSPSDWILAQTMEGYIGFARKSDFEMRNDYRLPDGLLKLPVALNDTGTTLAAGVFVYGAPDAGWHLFSGEKLPESAQVADLRPNFSAKQIQSLMKPFMGTSYVWGGVTDEGIDCSGFSQFFMRTAGVMIPRDAVQQATGGLIVAWGDDVAKKAQPGDLIFFARDTGRISHVAISLGGQRIIHSAGKGVHLSRLDEPRHEDEEETYGDGVLFARRVVVR